MDEERKICSMVKCKDWVVLLLPLSAPRKLVVAAGREDEIFPIEGTEKNFSQIKPIYTAAGTPNNCALVVGDKGHYNYADLIWQKLYEMGLKQTKR